MLPAVWGQDSTPGLPGSACTLAPGWAGGQRAGAPGRSGPSAQAKVHPSPLTAEGCACGYCPGGQAAEPLGLGGSLQGGLVSLG